MNRAGRIYKWIIISVIFQIIFLTYFNNVYLARRGDAKATLVDTKDETPKKDIKIDIPQNAEDIKVSYDSSLVSYLVKKDLIIVDINQKKTVKTISFSNEELTYYRWLPDRNMVIYAVKSPDSQPGKVYVATYNVDSEVDHIYPKITGLPSKSEITAIELSPLTNVVYAKVVTGTDAAKIYKYDIMSSLSYAFNTHSSSVIREMNYHNKMVYQDDKNKIYVWDGQTSSSKALSFKNKLALLSIVGLDDEVYVGELNAEGKVSSIHYGTVDQSIEKWNTIDLKTPATIQNIFITLEGNIFERVEEKNAVYNLKNNDKINYEGTFVEVFNKHIVTREGNNLKIKSINVK